MDKNEEVSTPNVENQMSQESSTTVNEETSAPVEAREIEQQPQTSSTTTNIFGVEEEQPKEQDAPKEEETTPTNIQETEEVEPVIDEAVINAQLNGKDQVVYEYKPPKNYGVWPFLLFFLFVGAIIIFLPSIQKVVTEYKNNKIIIGGGSTNTNNNPSSNEEEPPLEEMVYYDFNKETTISINKLTLNNFDKVFENSKYYVTVTVTNKDNSSYSFNENIFIELYNDKETLLSRVLLESENILNASSSSQVKLLIDAKAYMEVTKIVVKTITTENYSQITLQEDLREQQTLTCSLDNRTLVYTFKEYQLVSIDDTLNVLRSTYSDPSVYANELASYRQLAAQRGLITGISSSIVDAEDGFTMASKIDLASIANADLKSLDQKVYYGNKTEAKIISFETVARGYTCK